MTKRELKLYLASLPDKERRKIEIVVVTMWRELRGKGFDLKAMEAIGQEIQEVAKVNQNIIK